MRYRPKRENYPSGKYGDIDYQERLERYCTYLENKLSKLHQPTVIGRFCKECGNTKMLQGNGIIEPLCTCNTESKTFL